MQLLPLAKLRFRASCTTANAVFLKEVAMTNKEVLDALRQIKTYCAAGSLDKLNYAIKVIEKLDNDGIEKPLKTDFTKLKKAGE